jgi:L-rhamnose mutarotase
METIAFKMQLIAGFEAEYQKRHDEIWPELVAAIKDAGFTNYSLFRRGTQIVGYFEVEPDAATAFAKLGKAESNARWAKWFEEVIVNLTDNKGNLMEMTEVWHLD